MSYTLGSYVSSLGTEPPAPLAPLRGAGWWEFTQAFYETTGNVLNEEQHAEWQRLGGGPVFLRLDVIRGQSPDQDRYEVVVRYGLRNPVTRKRSLTSEESRRTSNRFPEVARFPQLSDAEVDRRLRSQDSGKGSGASSIGMYLAIAGAVALLAIGLRRR